MHFQKDQVLGQNTGFKFLDLFFIGTLPLRLESAGGLLPPPWAAGGVCPPGLSGLNSKHSCSHQAVIQTLAAVRWADALRIRHLMRKNLGASLILSWQAHSSVGRGGRNVLSTLGLPSIFLSQWQGVNVVRSLKALKHSQIIIFSSSRKAR